MFTCYADIRQFLHGLGLFHMDLSLSRMEKALQSLCLTRPNFVTVQVVGTNGKGSTSTFLESLARHHGLRTGLFTSPHFVSPRERICVNGLPLSEADWVPLAQKVHEAAPQLTYFEFLTVFALLAFQEARIDMAIIEAGLGGRHDATTALHRHALCLTPISLDHEHVLGSTLLAIAEDKAHAMAAHMPVFMAKQESTVQAFMHDFAQQCEARLYDANLSLLPQDVTLGLSGKHQKHNAALALSAWQHLSTLHTWPYEAKHIENALATAFIAGRLQHIICEEEQLPSHMLLDGAHNVQGLEMLIQHVHDFNVKPSAIIFSCLKDKDQEGMLHLLQKLHTLCAHCPLYIVDIQNNERALTIQEKEHIASTLGNHAYISQELIKTLAYLAQQQDAQAKHAPVLICGSLYLLGEFYAQYPAYLNKII